MHASVNLASHRCGIKDFVDDFQGPRRLTMEGHCYATFAGADVRQHRQQICLRMIAPRPSAIRRELFSLSTVARAATGYRGSFITRMGPRSRSLIISATRQQSHCAIGSLTIRFGKDRRAISKPTLCRLSLNELLGKQ